MTLDQVLVGQWHGLFQFSQNSNTPTHLVFRPARSWMQMHLVIKQRGAGRENDNCVRLKLAKNTCIAPHCTSVWLGQSVCMSLFYIFTSIQYFPIVNSDWYIFSATTEKIKNSVSFFTFYSSLYNIYKAFVLLYCSRILKQIVRY